MRKKLSCLMSVLLMVISVLACASVVPAMTLAAEMTVSGTVTDSTTQDVLYLNTSGGTMQIKLDSNTDTSGAKFLLPGNTLTCSIYTGNDEYWHASKITGSSSSGKVTVDSSNKATVKGTIAKGTSEELLYLVVQNGTMQIKLDSDTDISGCKYLIIGRTVNVVCARGSDAYMHALTITDASNYSGTVSTSSGTVSTTGVTGTIDKGTTTSLLRLSTSAGTMEFVLDLASDISQCRALVPGQSATVSFYRGDDAWNHVSKIVNNSSSVSDVANLDQGSKATVSGTIANNTNESMVYLDTNGGTMQIRIDSSTGFTKCPVLLVGKNAKIVCMRGSDEYFHAVSVEADY
ncbi:MAG: hypothetical protein II842_13705 [Butyrivibrio sp.]|nr:hypothetical protein [Butyrivibrio sp.]